LDSINKLGIQLPNPLSALEVQVQNKGNRVGSEHR